MIAPDSAPILFNALKHHRGYLHQLIAQMPSSIHPHELRRLLLPIGAAQLDFYTGRLTTEEIMAEVRGYLQSKMLFESARYSSWVLQNEGYCLLKLSDQSDWVLRIGHHTQQWVHLHPARCSQHTIRIKAHMLKTAIWLAVKHPDKLAEAAKDLSLINNLRAQLGLSPLSDRQLNTAAISEIVKLLRSGSSG